MMLLRPLILLLTSSISLGQTPAILPSAALAGPEIFKLSDGTVFKLVTSLFEVNSSRSHGTAFAIGADGYLITNYHVVADALDQPQKYELKLEMNGQKHAADVLFIDPVNDIALVKAEVTFGKILPIATEFKAQMGETLYSLGFPASEEISMIQGTFNGQRLMGFSPVITASMPLNQGMSGGPLLNSRGEVVGVNRALLVKAQNISYFSPWAALVRIGSRAKGEGRKLASQDWRRGLIGDISRQEKWAMSLPASLKTNRQRIGQVSFAVPLGTMQCGQDYDGKSNRDTQFLVCQNVSLALAGPDVAALSVRTAAVQNKSSFRMIHAFDILQAQYSNLQKQRKEKSRGQRGLASVDKNQERCNTRNVRNKNALDLRVRYCAYAVPGFQGLYSTFVKIDVPAKSGSGTSLAQSYDGMTMTTTAAMVEKFLDSIERVP